MTFYNFKANFIYTLPQSLTKKQLVNDLPMDFQATFSIVNAILDTIIYKYTHTHTHKEREREREAYAEN